MPNTGKPSQDCHLCRTRRVKCDLARPACQRCIKYGVDCPGYRDLQELVFRNANPVTAKKRKKRAKDAADSTFPSQFDSDSTPSPPGNYNDGTLVSSADQTRFAGTWGYPLTKPLTEHWTTHSVPIILNVYSTLEFVHDIYRSNVQNGPLLWAAHLFSRTYVTNIRYPTSKYTESQEETDRELGVYLSKTLTSVNAALQKPEGAQRNDVLATVWILCNYELLVGTLDRVEAYSPWHLHAQGLYSILKARGTASLCTDRGRMAFWPAYNMVQVNALVSNIECPPESDEWLDFIKSSMHPHEGLALHVSYFIIKVAHVQCRILNMLRARNFVAASSEYATLVGDMTTAEWEMNAFMELNTHLVHELDPYMHDLRHATIVKGYHIMQLLVNFLTHYAPCKVSVKDLTAYRTYCIQSIRDSAQAILEHTPLAVETLAKDKTKSPKVLFDALKMVWPLTVVYIISSTLPEQKKQAEMALTFIGKEIGVRQALSTYPANHALPPEAQLPLDSEEEAAESMGKLGGESLRSTL